MAFPIRPDIAAKLWTKGKILDASRIGDNEEAAPSAAATGLSAKERRLSKNCLTCGEELMQPKQYGLATFNKRRVARRIEVWVCAACGWVEKRLGDI